MRKTILLLITLIILFSFTPINNFRDLVVDKLNDYDLDYPEKLYVQTDKPYYSIGEDIWFTTYLINGITHTKSNKSNVVYVDLINDKDSLVSQRKLYIKDISAAADFNIDKKWKSGSYLLRAYTRHMSNANSGFYFQKEIPIWNIDKAKNLDKNSITLNNITDDVDNQKIIGRPDLNFYPEGGYLVNGLKSKIAIKIKDLKNNISFDGVIKDSQSNIITKFKTHEFGLGFAYLNPERGNSYYASIFVNGKEETYQLPKALSRGYNLQITNNFNQINLKATSNTHEGLKNSLLVIHQRGKIIFEKLEPDTTYEYALKLNTHNLKSGVTNFTLFNSDGKPVCERLVFVSNPEENFKINVNSNFNGLKTREKATLSINIQDTKGNYTNGNLSLSITDINAVEQNSRNETIKTYLLLNSDLRGHIENPGYFFEKENDHKRQYLLDLLMLTHGWSRFTWSELLYATKNHIEPEKGLIISGQTHGLNQQEKQISAATRLSILGNIIHQESVQSDIRGHFKYGPFVYYDSVPIIIEARLRDFKTEFTDNRNVSIKLEKNKNLNPRVIRKNVVKWYSEDQPTIVNYINKAQEISKINEEYLQDAIRLEEILIRAKKKSEKEKRTEIFNERTNNVSPTHRIDLEDVIGGESLSVLLLLSSMPGVVARDKGFSIRNGGPARILLNGFQVTFNDIAFLRGTDIEFIDVLSGANAGFYSNAGNGIISIYTKTSNFNSLKIKRKPGIINFQAVGFYTARAFYAPDHSNSFDKALKQDIRTTLHWEPKISLTEESKKAEVSFFTSDAKSNYALKIEGITDTGIPVYHLSTFEVD